MKRVLAESPAFVRRFHLPSSHYQERAATQRYKVFSPIQLSIIQDGLIVRCGGGFVKLASF